MKIKLFFTAPLCLLLVCLSCQKDYSPKPSAYFRIDEQKEKFVVYQTPAISFEVSSQATVSTEKKGAETWITIRYPQYRAYLYCTYLPISKGSLRPTIDDSYRMAFSHTVKANGIAQEVLRIPAQKTGGILYKIGGNVATPRQFFVTDSTSHFFRASLYFDGKANADSLMPVVNYMDRNIHRLASSLKWKN
jgi:gliding motility-associated lipoprotein GldD